MKPLSIFSHDITSDTRHWLPVTVASPPRIPRRRRGYNNYYLVNAKYVNGGSDDKDGRPFFVPSSCLLPTEFLPEVVRIKTH